ncbi:MAG: hypothetical protein ACXV3D_00250 [Halobacteriota archaeon]
MIKKAAIVVALVVLASLLVAGCTSPTTSSPTPSASASTNTDVSTALTNEFTGRGFVVMQPFVKSTNGAGLVTYAGAFKDSENTLTPYVHNVTILLTKDRNATKTQFDSAVATAQARGYQGTNTGNVSGGSIWQGSVGRHFSNPTDFVYISAQQPSQGVYYEIIHGPSEGRAYATSLGSEWLVSTDYATKA